MPRKASLQLALNHQSAKVRPHLDAKEGELRLAFNRQSAKVPEI